MDGCVGEWVGVLAGATLQGGGAAGPPGCPGQLTLLFLALECSSQAPFCSVYLAFSECYQSTVTTHYFKGQYIPMHAIFYFPSFPIFLRKGMLDSKVPDSLSISDSPDFI